MPDIPAGNIRIIKAYTPEEWWNKSDMVRGGGLTWSVSMSIFSHVK